MNLLSFFFFALLVSVSESVSPSVFVRSMSDDFSLHRLSEGGEPPSWFLPTPSTPATGTGTSTGGGFVSFSTAGVGICVLNTVDIGVSFCGGYIGVSGRIMCVVPNCTKKAHSAKVGAEDLNPHVAGNAVFIEASSKGVYIDPVVPITYFGSKLSRYLSERRPLAAWEALLRGMIAEGKPNGPDPDDLDAFFKRFLSRCGG